MLVKIEEYKDSLSKLTQYPVQYIRTNSVLKLTETDSHLTIGLARENQDIKKQLREFHRGKEVRYVSIDPGELASFISKQGIGEGSSVTGDNLEENDLNKLANDAPIINLVNSIIIDGINKGASDIHIEGYRDKVELRYRVDGVLVEGESITPNLFRGVSSRIKIMGNLNIMERRQPQDGRSSVTLNSNKVDLRISIIPLSQGESIVLRLFIKKSKLVNLRDLGFKDNQIELFNSLTTLPHGLILITGPTGSGKTTTLNAILNSINSREKKIITIEDPVEYSIDGVNQIQVNHEIGLNFSSVLRRVLRQDPDIIMIGEIRDEETADLVVRAALTGHLVLSTLHTNDAPSSLARLRDMGIPNYLISSVLRGSFAQRLVRKLCTKCGGDGCRECSNTGYKGRLAILEGFKVDEKLEELIIDDAKGYKIKEFLQKRGMKTLKEIGVEAVKSGITDSRELTRVLSC